MLGARSLYAHRRSTGFVDRHGFFSQALTHATYYCGRRHSANIATGLRETGHVFIVAERAPDAEFVLVVEEEAGAAGDGH